MLKPIRLAPAPERLGYRSKSWLRSEFQNGVLSFGMLRSVRDGQKWVKELVSWDTCPLHTKAIQRVIERLRSLLPKVSLEFVQGDLFGIWIGGADLVVISRSSGVEVLSGIDWSKVLVPPLRRVWTHSNPQVGRKIFGHHPIDLIYGTLDQRAPPIRSFRQTAQTLLIEARNQAVRALLCSSPQLLVDLYCGNGDLSLLLPAEVGWLGIELSSDSVRYASGLRPDSSSLQVAFAGAVEQRLSDPKVLELIKGPYALYLNPPRSGLSEEASSKVFGLIQKQPPMNVVYLSCSASSLARDLVKFEAVGLQVRHLQPYDFFPQTEHFETLAVLSPR